MHIVRDECKYDEVILVLVDEVDEPSTSAFIEVLRIHHPTRRGGNVRARSSMASMPTSGRWQFFEYIRYMYFPPAPSLRSSLIRVYPVGGTITLEVPAETKMLVTDSPKLGSVE